jgi:hypothetical protein
LACREEIVQEFGNGLGFFAIVQMCRNVALLNDRTEFSSVSLSSSLQRLLSKPEIIHGPRGTLPRPTARCHSDKYADSQCYRDSNERTLFSFLRDLVQRRGPVPRGIFAESRRLLAE